VDHDFEKPGTGKREVSLEFPELSVLGVPVEVGEVPSEDLVGFEVDGLPFTVFVGTLLTVVVESSSSPLTTVGLLPPTLTLPVGAGTVEDTVIEVWERQPRRPWGIGRALTNRTKAKIKRTALRVNMMK
jgi:hypothetical protein